MVSVTRRAREFDGSLNRRALDLRKHRWRENFVLEVLDQHSVDFLAPRRNPRAHCNAAILARRACVIARARRNDSTAADAAAEQAPKERRGNTASAASSASMPRRVHAHARCIPGCVVNDAQLGALLDLPFFARPRDALALPRIRILHPARAVPDIPAAVELVVQQARALRWRPVESRHAPCSTTRAAYAACVQIRGDALAGFAAGVAREDLPEDLGLRLVDLEPVSDRLAAGIHAGDHGPIAERKAARVEAARDLTDQAAMRLLAQVVEVRLVDHAAYAAQELPAVARRRVVAIGHTNDANPTVLKPPHDRFLLDLVARETIQALDEQHRKASGQCVGQHCAAAGTILHAGSTAHRAVGVDRDDVEF